MTSEDWGMVIGLGIIALIGVPIFVQWMMAGEHQTFEWKRHH